MSKNFKRYLLVTFIILIIYNLLVFTFHIKQQNITTFWVTWGFGLIAIIFQPLIAILGMKGPDTLKSKVYGWPIIRLGYIYLIIQLALCLLLFALNIFFKIPTAIILVLSLILIGLISIGLIVSDTYKEEIIKMEENEPITTKFINDLKADSKILLTRIKEEKIRKNFEAFVEEVKYSDPVSSESSIEIEDEINRKYIEVKDAIINEKYENIIQEINELLSLVQERNERVKTNKK